MPAGPVTTARHFVHRRVTTPSTLWSTAPWRHALRRPWKKGPFSGRPRFRVSGIELQRLRNRTPHRAPVAVSVGLKANVQSRRSQTLHVWYLHTQTLHVWNICLHWGGLGVQYRHISHTWSVWDTLGWLQGSVWGGKKNGSPMECLGVRCRQSSICHGHQHPTPIQ